MNYDRQLDLFFIATKVDGYGTVFSIGDERLLAEDKTTRASVRYAQNYADRKKNYRENAYLSMETELNNDEKLRTPPNRPYPPILEGKKYVAAFLNISDFEKDKNKKIPALEGLLTWLCASGVENSKLMFLGHGSGMANGNISISNGFKKCSLSPTDLAHVLLNHGLRREKKIGANILGVKPNAYWVPDKESPACNCCKKKFQGVFFKGKHHCRRCGKVVCEDCSKARQILDEAVTANGVQKNPGGKQRVCKTCVNELLNPTSKVSTRSDFVGSLKTICVFSCRAGQGVETGDRLGTRTVDPMRNKFANESFAARFAKALKASGKVAGVKITAIAEIAELDSAGFKTGRQIRAPGESTEIDNTIKQIRFRYQKDGMEVFIIPGVIYGKSDAHQATLNWREGKTFAGREDFLANLRKQASRWQDLEKAGLTITVKGPAGPLHFGKVEHTNLNELSTQFKRWDFPYWTQRVVVTQEGNKWVAPSGHRTQGYIDNFKKHEKKGGFSDNNWNTLFPDVEADPMVYTLELTPPPGSFNKIEHLPHAENLILLEGKKSIPWKDTKIVEVI